MQRDEETRHRVMQDIDRLFDADRPPSQVAYALGEVFRGIVGERSPQNLHFDAEQFMRAAQKRLFGEA